MSDKKHFRKTHIMMNYAAILLLMFLFICFSSNFELFAQDTNQSVNSETPLSVKARVEIEKFLNSNYNIVSEIGNTQGSAIQVHPFSGFDNQCDKCHEVHKTTGAEASYIVLRVNSSKLLSDRCVECHPMNSNGHPIMIKPLFPIPKDFPLSNENELTCVSCHNPHHQRYSNRSWIPRTYLEITADFFMRKKQFKTHFLRRNNSKKELCLACHQGIRQHWGLNNQP